MLSTNISKDQYLYDPKIRSSFALGQAINAIRIAKPNSRIGFTHVLDRNGSFNHKQCVYLSLCRGQCDILIVGIQRSQNFKEFAFLLSSLPVVDYVVDCPETLEKSIEEINPHVVFYEQSSGTSFIKERYGQTSVQKIEHAFGSDDFTPLRF